MRPEGGGDFAENPWAITIVRIQNRHRLAGGPFNAFIHRVIMAFVLLGNPNQMRMLAQNLQRAIDDPFQNSLSVFRRPQRRVHFEVGVVAGPSRFVSAVCVHVEDRRAVATPEMIAAREGRIRQGEMVWASLRRDRYAPLPGFAEQPHAAAGAEVLAMDVQAAYDGDPACKSLDEVIFCYPGLHALWGHRVEHWLWQHKLHFWARLFSHWTRFWTQIEIHPGAKLGHRFFIDHGSGVVIGETTTIGRNVKIYQGVTLGALSPFDKKGHPARGVKRHPDIEDDVIIYANATILGGETVIGRGAIIGGNTWITASVPAKAVVYKSQET
jgi:serine O-acetyltransferase